MKDWRFPGLLTVVFLLLVTVTLLSVRVKQETVRVDRLQVYNGMLTQTIGHMTKEIGRLREVVKSHEQRIQRWEALTSWYGPGFHGKRTASGTIYDQNGYTCAHKTLPLGTVLVLENPSNKRRVTCVVTDRGPYIRGRSLDVSFRIAEELGMVRKGVQDLIVYQVSL